LDRLVLLIPLSVVLALLIGWFFWRAVDTGQFDDLDTPAVRIVADDDTPQNEKPAEAQAVRTASPQNEKPAGAQAIRAAGPAAQSNRTPAMFFVIESIVAERQA
jgi:cbb3-type cytochrome oxidase maturation protein